MEKIFFVKINDFDNSECIREPIVPKGSIHAWAVQEKDFETFSEFHPNHTLINPEGKTVYAIDYIEIDDYVTGNSSFMPPLLDFNKEEHTATAFSGEYQVILV